MLIRVHISYLVIAGYKELLYGISPMVLQILNFVCYSAQYQMFLKK